MKSSDFSAQFPELWASSATSDTITYPIPATTATTGRAALGTGFTTANMTPLSAGGVPPFGQDFNGVLKMLSTSSQNYESGSIPAFNADFATAVGGYPLNAIVTYGSTAGQFWVSTADDNITVPGTSNASWAVSYLTQSKLDTLYVKQYTDDETYEVTQIGINKTTGDFVAYADGAWQSYQPAGDYATNSQVLSYLLAGTGLGKSQANPGYQILPGGTIIQYGSSSSGGSGNTEITFPITFPNACISVNLTESNASSTWPGNGSSGTPTLHGVSNGASTQSFGAYSMRWQNSNWGGSAGLGFMWVAVGY